MVAVVGCIWLQDIRDAGGIFSSFSLSGRDKSPPLPACHFSVLVILNGYAEEV